MRDPQQDEHQTVSRRGWINILLSSKESLSTPLALVEIGCKNKDWWKKLDQARKCLDIMDCDRMDEKQSPAIYSTWTFDVKK